MVKNVASRISWAFAIAILVFVTTIPYLYYRHRYETHKRIRPIVEGLVYRSGCMTESGMEATLRKFGIKTVINLQEEAPDPVLPTSIFTSSGTKESEVVRRTGAKMISLTVDVLYPLQIGIETNAILAEFYRIMDDPQSYPVLIHCRAGLHRTGCMAAVYRMEYNGWSKEQALRELKSHGFGYYASSRENQYIEQYLHQYKPRDRRSPSAPRTPLEVPGLLTSRPKNHP